MQLLIDKLKNGVQRSCTIILIVQTDSKACMIVHAIFTATKPSFLTMKMGVVWGVAN